MNMDSYIAFAHEYGIERHNKVDALGLLEASMIRALFTEVDSDEFDEKLESVLKQTSYDRQEAYKTNYHKFDKFADVLNTEKEYIPYAFDMIFEAI